MKAAVSARFWIFDIVFLLKKCDVILRKQTVRKHVDIIWKRADDTDAGNIMDIFFNRRKGERYILFTDLFDQAFHGFDTGFDILNRIAVIFQGILFV